jgi:endonuclease G
MKTIVSLLIAFVATAAVATCPQLYPNGVAIAPANRDVIELCNSFYVAHYDQAHSRVVFTSARLEPGTAIGAPTRISGFRPDSRVKNSPRTALYETTGFDRGHMVAAEDAATDQQMYDTFYLTNVVPQVPILNRGKWKQIEARVRAAAIKSPTITWIVTVPVYNVNPTLLADRIPIPAGMWKMSINGTTDAFYFADNKSTATVVPYSKPDWRTLIKNQSNILR